MPTGGFSLGKEGELTTAAVLGYSKAARLLIINADDAGMCHSVNQETIAALERGLVTSASLIVPSCWFAEIAGYARDHPQMDFGVHLTFTSEWEHYRWGPVSGAASVPSLCAPDGCMWRTGGEMLAHAQPEDVLAEARAQIERCLDVGVDATHLDCHMDMLLLDARFRAILLDLAESYGLSTRVFQQSVGTNLGADGYCAEARGRGILFPDEVVSPDPRVDTPVYWRDQLARLNPGVSLVYVHPAIGGEELLAITGTSNRLEDYRLFGPDRLLEEAVQRGGAILIGYRPLRERQRRLPRAGAGCSALSPRDSANAGRRHR